jgi:DNA-binding response OmpR family regulator
MTAVQRNKVASNENHQKRVPAVLLVEDEIMIRMTLAEFLRDCGFKVYEAGDAAEAIEILEAGNRRIDLVFSDVRMPGPMDGFGLARWVREHRKGMPVMLTSGDRRKAEAAKVLCESEPYFEKPYDLDAVVAEIRRVIEAREPK